jgi:dolichol-phosphate mannosyltransferase
VNYSIIIPVLNEEKNLSKLIPEIFFRLKKVSFELIIIDDNSEDNTSILIRKLKRKNLRYFIRKKDKDLSRACIYGFNKSKFKNIIVMDGDFQHKPKDILKLISCFEKNKADMVIGTRNLFKKNDKSLSFLRLNASRILVLFVSFFLGKKTRDPMSGFFIFRKKIFQNVKKSLLKDGYKILLDLIYTKENHKRKILDVSINFDSRKKGKSKMKLNIIIKLIKMILIKYYILNLK